MIDSNVSLGLPEVEKGLLYHYTTQDGLLGIIDSSCIWATHAGFLNDASEFKRGLGIVRHQLDEFRFNPSSVKMARQSTSPAEAELERVMVDNFRRALLVVDEVDVFVASFFDATKSSTTNEGRDAGDVLDQWRAYSKGNMGFSIGFDKASLSNHIAQMGISSCVITRGSCNYDEDLQEKYLKGLIDEFGSSILTQIYSFIHNFAHERAPALPRRLREISNQPRDAELERLVEEISNRIEESLSAFEEVMGKEFKRIDREIITQLAKIMKPLAFIKHPSFGAENEWRIAEFDFRTKSNLKFRPSPSSLVPYREIHLPIDDPDSNIIRRIVVGPSPKIHEAVLATKMFLRCKGCRVKEHGSERGIEVAPSQLPFRNW